MLIQLVDLAPAEQVLAQMDMRVIPQQLHQAKVIMVVPVMGVLLQLIQAAVAVVPVV